MFGKGDPRPMPMSSIGCFGLRDSMTILASFSLPGILSEHLQEKYTLRRGTADTTAQLFTPVSMQILSTPFHLYGLDMYNRSQVSGLERWTFIQQEYIKTTLARMARIFPAYGIGGVVNKQVRKMGHRWLYKNYGDQRKEEETRQPQPHVLYSKIKR
jgi:hypothetical protein